MAKKLYNEEYIYDIACAIREKCGDKKATFKTCDMADAIRDLEIGGGGGGTGEGGIPVPLTLEGSCYRMFSASIWNDFIEEYGDQLQINTNQLYCAFDNNPFLSDASNLTINVYLDDDQEKVNSSSIFSTTYRIRQLPTIKGDWVPDNFFQLFYKCYYLQSVPSKFFKYVDWSYIQANPVNTYETAFMGALGDCYSLRSFPVDVFANDYTQCSSYFYWTNLSSKYAMEKWSNLPIPYTKPLTGKTIDVKQCSVLDEFTFALDDNDLPITVNWTNMTIDLSSCVGYATSSIKNNYLLEYAGFDEELEVTSALSYEELKEEDEWFTCDVNFSRYNHDSAYQTILSLPDTNASTTGGNVIKFKSGSGAATDGGPISALTESEIAVAAIKGWTVTLVD